MAPLVFVLGKGGVGRSTIAAALALDVGARGGRALIVQWAVADAISPWFGRPPVGHAFAAIAPRVETMNYSAEETLREYFVDHLGLGLFYRAVVHNRHVRRFSRAIPGLDELLFLGRLMWLTTLAEKERGWHWDRVIVDAPATGHGLSLFAVPRAAGSLGLGGLLADECRHVSALLANPAHTAALVVTTAEELAVEETLELWPRLSRELGRAPLACVVNRAAGPLLGAPVALPPIEGIARVYQSLQQRIARERALADRLAPLVSVDDQWLRGIDAPDEVARAAAQAVACLG